MVCLSVTLLCYRITYLWFCSKRVCNTNGALLCQTLYYRLWGAGYLCHSYSLLLLSCQGSHRQRISDRTWLCPNKTIDKTRQWAGCGAWAIVTDLCFIYVNIYTRKTTTAQWVERTCPWSFSNCWQRWYQNEGSFPPVCNSSTTPASSLESALILWKDSRHWVKGRKRLE